MKKILKIGSLASIAILTLSGCGIAKEFQPLPDEERYFYIDKVLSDIDYQNVGEIVSEGRDENGGTFVASYKSVGYETPKSFEKIAKKLEKPEDKNIYSDCKYIETSNTFGCNYYGTTILMSKSDSGVIITITDSTSGRKSK